MQKYSIFQFIQYPTFSEIYLKNIILKAKIVNEVINL